jgi:ribonuclease HI
MLGSELWFTLKTAMKSVIITTDGACIGNPGPGGWACILRFGNSALEMFGSQPRTTNNRMELTAVIKALQALKEPCKITLYSDSQYVTRGMTEWLSGWKAKGWKRRVKGEDTAVVNRDLWMELDQLAQRHQISWNWVRGHANHADNIRCDLLAERAAAEQTASRRVVKKVVCATTPETSKAQTTTPSARSDGPVEWPSSGGRST